MRWLQDQGMQIQRVIAIEDSASGITMAEVVSALQVPVEFVYTGQQPLPERIYGIPIISTSHKYEQGTIEYLAHYQQLQRV